MGKESEDKAERILSIFTKLKQGKIIYKNIESNRYHVAPRTIQRDIADIQCFLQNRNIETGEVQEVIFDKKLGGYVMQTRKSGNLEGKEILAVAKVILESRALTKKELFPILHKLINLCSNEEDVKVVQELLKNEMHHYVELRHGKDLLDILWLLEQAVKNKNYIEIQYKKLKNNETVTRKVKPVGIMFSEFYFYLTAFIENIDKEKAFQNPDDIFPTIYRVDRLKEVVIKDEHFVIPYADRFEEGEFRKRIQFMYGGKLRKIIFKYSGNDIDAILDRLPTAIVLKEEGEVYTISAEVFGKGIDMWLKSQGNTIKMIN